jgi:hypothetical protein
VWVAVLCPLLAALALVGCGATPPDAHGCAAALLPGDLVITEVFADFTAPSGGSRDAGKEWFEIYNARGEPIDLAGVAIVHSRPDGSRSNVHVIRQARIVAGQYFTLGSAAPGALPPYIDYSYGTDLGELYNTDGGKLALSCGDAEIDSAAYADIQPGHARELTGAQPPDYTLNDDARNWCPAGDREFEAGNFGTPGAASDCRAIVADQCSDGDALRAIVAPAVGQLVISEILANPANVPGTTDATREWFEVANTGATAFDLNQLAVGRIGAPGAPVQSPRCLSVPPHGFAVFARSADAALDGMLPSVAATFRFALVDSHGDIAISRGDALLDAVRWTSVTPGIASQLEPAHLTAVDNDDPARFCAATTAYGDGTNRGTPGAANQPCP